MLFITSKMRAKEILSLFMPAVLCVSLIHMSLVNIQRHTPQDLIEFSKHKQQQLTDHGHTHSDFEDLFWLLHGHSHDNIDHDHSAVVFSLPPSTKLPEKHNQEYKALLPSIKKAAIPLHDPPPRA